LIVIFKGKVVSENYYHNSSIEDTFNICSVTKSFMSTLVGQAVDMGFMEDPDRSASQFFPDYNISYLDDIKLHHFLSMSSGYAEEWSFLNQPTEEILSGDHDEPGSFFYNNNACHVNAHALYYSTMQTPYEFASTYLFPYLGIYNPDWTSGYIDINNGSYDLRLNLRDMVKLGQLYIQDGFSGDEQLLSKDWIIRATSPQVDKDSWGYGYLWWLPETDSYLAWGAGGQYIVVFPNYELVIGTHSERQATQLAYKIYSDIAPIFNRIPLVINEILITNNNCCTDENGEYDSYIEIYNYGIDTIDVGGPFLTNNINNFDNYFKIPTGNDSTIIPPEQFLLLWSDNFQDQSVLHIDNILSNLGGNIWLCSNDTSTIIDQISYSVQAPGIAYAIIEDVNEVWIYMEPTPLLANNTILNIDQDSNFPKKIHVKQNYLNPFNPSTKIRCFLVS